MPFDRVPPEMDFPRKSTRILAFWRERGIFEKTLVQAGAEAARSSSTRGRRPPTGCRTTGTSSRASSRTSSPATRRCAARACRARRDGTRTGCRSRSRSRRSSASTARPPSRQYGVEPFVKKCIESVFRYTREWEELTERVAFWVDLARRVRHLPPLVRRERVVGALASSSRRGCSTRGTRSSGGGRRAGRRSARARWGRGTERSTTRACTSRFPLVGRGRTSSLLVWTTTPVDACRRTCTPPSTRRSTTSSCGRRTAQRFVVAQALVEALAQEARRAVGRARDEGPDLVGKPRTARPSTSSRDDARGLRGRRLARHRRRLRHARRGHRHRPHRPRVRRGRPRGPPQARARATRTCRSSAR